MLANAATTPIWGKLSDLFNKKLLVQLSIVIFVAGSVMAGLSQSIPMLLTARVIQGVALGGLTALAQAIIGTMIAPRERGRYSGYMGAVMAVGTAGGPLLGGVIVDSPLGWRWTFYICVPLAVIALVLLQKTLKIVHVRKAAKIDWAGSILLTAGVSLILIWISFAGKVGYYDWISWQSALMAGGGLLLLVVMLFVESKVSEPIIPLKIISQRTTALAILASVAVGVALFGSSTFLGQYFQISRGATPTEAGLLMLPLIAGNLIGSVLSGQLISRFGKWKRFLVAGAILLIGGLGFAGSIDHTTNLTLVGLFIFIMGLGLGLMLQNLVLAVQNTVRVEDIGSASSSVAFFRSFGGAIGVSVLGAVLANRVTSLSSDGLTKLGVPSSAQQSGGTLDLADMPAPIRDVIRAAYGDATSLIFTISAIIAVVALIAVLFIKERALRTTVELKEPVADAPLVQQSEPELDLDQEFAEVLSATGSIPKVGPTRFAEATQPGKRVLLIEEPVAQTLADTQQLLARQQLQLSTAMSEVHRISAEQQALQSQQAQTAQGLIDLERQLAAERRIQQAAAHYLASRAGREDGQLG